MRVLRYLLDKGKRLVQPRLGTKNKGRGIQGGSLQGKFAQRQRGGGRWGGKGYYDRELRRTQPLPAAARPRQRFSCFHMRTSTILPYLPPLNSLWDKSQLASRRSRSLPRYKYNTKFNLKLHLLPLLCPNFIYENIYGNKISYVFQKYSKFKIISKWTNKQWRILKARGCWGGDPLTSRGRMRVVHPRVLASMAFAPNRGRSRAGYNLT